MVLPTTAAVPLNKDHISKLAKSDRVAAGYFAGQIVDAEAHDPKKDENHTLMSRLKFRLLEDPSNADSAKGLPVSTWISWALEHPSFPDETPPSYTTDASCGILSAIYPNEVYNVPRLHKRRLYFKGEEIDQSEKLACREEALDSASAKMAEVYNDHSLLVGHVIFFEIFYKKGSDMPSLAGFSAEQAEGKDLSAVYVEVGGEADDGASKSKARSASRRASKKGKKTKGRRR